MTGAFHYVGDELDVFAHARKWKARLAEEIRPFLGARVLEVGAGLGETTKALVTSRQTSWTLLEPDPLLAQAAGRLVDAEELPRSCRVVVGSTSNLEGADTFDSVIYVDVLEHIADDRGELTRAAGLVEDGGHLIVMSPAHQWLYSPFDARIGHVRRYSRRTLGEAGPEGCRLLRLRYLDAAGLLASLANRVLLRQAMPTLEQVITWDRTLVPMSRWLDPLLGYRVGKSVIAVWQRASTPAQG